MLLCISVCVLTNLERERIWNYFKERFVKLQIVNLFKYFHETPRPHTDVTKTPIIY